MVFFLTFFNAKNVELSSINIADWPNWENLIVNILWLGTTLQRYIINGDRQLLLKIQNVRYVKRYAMVFRIMSVCGVVDWSTTVVMGRK